MRVVNRTAVTITGGFDFRIGAVAVRAHDAFNPLQLFWILIALWSWLRWRPRVVRDPDAAAPPDATNYPAIGF